MPSAVILLSATQPKIASVFCLSSFLALSLATDELFVPEKASLRIVSTAETGPLPPRGFSEGRSHSDVLISLGKNPVWSLRDHGILRWGNHHACGWVSLQYRPVRGFPVIGSIAEKGLETGTSLIKQLRHLRTVALMKCSQGAFPVC